MKKNSNKTVIKKDKFGYLAITLKLILMGLGFYFLTYRSKKSPISISGG